MRATFEEIGLVFSQTSGHTDRRIGSARVEAELKWIRFASSLNLDQSLV